MFLFPTIPPECIFLFTTTIQASTSDVKFSWPLWRSIIFVPTPRLSHPCPHCPASAANPPPATSTMEKEDRERLAALPVEALIRIIEEKDASNSALEE